MSFTAHNQLHSDLAKYFRAILKLTLQQSKERKQERDAGNHLVRLLTLTFLICQQLPGNQLTLSLLQPSNILTVIEHLKGNIDIVIECFSTRATSKKSPIIVSQLEKKPFTASQ